MGLAHSPSIVTDGLVLCLDAGNPKSYPGSGTAWTDLSGNGNHATLIGNANYVTWNSSGYFVHNPGNVHFGAPNSGSVSSLDFGAYWNVSSNQSLNPSNGWTVSGFLSIPQIQSSNGVGWFVLDDADLRIHLEPISDSFRANASDGWSQIYYPISQYYNQFTNYTFVFTKGSTNTGTIQFYINGNLVATDTSFTPAATTDYQINLGRRMGHFYHFMKANVATYQYYTRPLSAVEVTSNFNALRGRFGL